jgi:pyrroline-5-carboxylate reductase
MTPILLIGPGRMGGALIQGWRAAGAFQASDLIIRDPHVDAAAFAGARVNPPLEALSTAKTVLLAVKPQTLPEILPEYRRYADRGALIISIAAGRTIDFLRGHLGADARIVRCMPNTPAAIGEGITGATAAVTVDADARELAARLLSPVGEVIWFEDEAKLDAVTALSGSGPAYVFYLIECMAAAGAELGLPDDIAARLARQTVIGAANLAKVEYKVPPNILREAVTSPNGTTAAALAVLMQDGQGLKELMQKALRAAEARAKELNS